MPTAIMNCQLKPAGAHSDRKLARREEEKEEEEEEEEQDEEKEEEADEEEKRTPFVKDVDFFPHEERRA